VLAGEKLGSFEADQLEGFRGVDGYVVGGSKTNIGTVGMGVLPPCGSTMFCLMQYLHIACL
jgi:hypothetical protein